MVGNQCYLLFFMAEIAKLRYWALEQMLVFAFVWIMANHTLPGSNRPVYPSLQGRKTLMAFITKLRNLGNYLNLRGKAALLTTTMASGTILLRLVDKPDDLRL